MLDAPERVPNVPSQIVSPPHYLKVRRTRNVIVPHVCNSLGRQSCATSIFTKKQLDFVRASAVWCRASMQEVRLLGCMSYAAPCPGLFGALHGFSSESCKICLLVKRGHFGEMHLHVRPSRTTRITAPGNLCTRPQTRRTDIRAHLPQQRVMERLDGRTHSQHGGQPKINAHVLSFCFPKSVFPSSQRRWKK